MPTSSVSRFAGRWTQFLGGICQTATVCRRLVDQILIERQSTLEQQKHSSLLDLSRESIVRGQLGRIYEKQRPKWRKLLPNSNAARDEFLDCAKSVAICLVVGGHYIQFTTPSFDENLLFRLIYSFHMPFFMFISGMVSSFWLARFLQTAPDSFSARLRIVLREVRSKAARLLIPFASWAIVSFVLTGPQPGDIVPWMLTLARNLDNGLWFLPVLFEVTLLLYVVAVFAPKIRLPKLIYFGLAGPVIWVAILLIPSGVLGLSLIKWLFPFFYGGVMFWYYRRGDSIRIWAISGALVFVALAPFWYRLHPSILTENLPLGRLSDLGYRAIVGFAGTFLAVGIAKAISISLRGRALKAVTFVGRRSLDIYAIHFHFVTIWPPVVGAIVLSLMISFVLRLNQWTKALFFGERRKYLPATTPQGVVSD